MNRLILGLSFLLLTLTCVAQDQALNIGDVAPYHP